MKKFIAILLVAMMVLTLAPFARADEEEKLDPADFPKIGPSDMVVKVDDGEPVNVKMYPVTLYFEEGEDQWTNTYYYVRLRDMAAVLNGTDAQFGIEFNNETKVVNLIPGKGYEKLDTDLIERPNETKFEKVEAFFEVNGTAVEKPFDTIIVNKEYYVNLYSLRKKLGSIYYSTLDRDNMVFTIYPRKSDVKNITADDLKALYGESEYTMVFVWAPWCPWCKKEDKHINEFLEFAKNEDVKVISLVYDYDNADIKGLNKLMKIENPSDKHLIYGIDEALWPYVEENFHQEDGNVYFPTVKLFDKEGNILFEYSNGEPYSWVNIVERAKNGELQELIEEREKKAKEEAEKQAEENNETEETEETEENK